MKTTLCHHQIFKRLIRSRTHFLKLYIVCFIFLIIKAIQFCKVHTVIHLKDIRLQWHIDSSDKATYFDVENLLMMKTIKDGNSFLKPLSNAIQVYKSQGREHDVLREKQQYFLIQAQTESWLVKNTPSFNDTRKATEKLLSQFYPDTQRAKYPLSTSTDPYYINNNEVCSNVSKLSLLVLVVSAANHFGHRVDIRRSWGNTSLYSNYEIRVVFLLGRPLLHSTQERIEHESKCQKDIIQGNFIDSYPNLTEKSVLATRWVSETCMNSILVAKVDDDVFVNVPEILTNMDAYIGNKTTEIYCHVRKSGSSVIDRGKTRWQVPSDYFVNHTFYPFPYCSGFFLIMTPDMSALLYKQAKHTPYFWIEDVYLTGILTTLKGSLKLIDVDAETNSQVGKDCFKSKGNACKKIAVTAYKHDCFMMWFYSRQIKTNL